jgi:hypothetical protein
VYHICCNSGLVFMGIDSIHAYTRQE